jgi:uncharacterized protein
MSGPVPEESVRVPVLRQRWRDVLFVHWRYPAATIAPLLPEPLTPDVIDGSAWVSATPFVVRGASVPPLPVMPSISTFPETNVRTYVRGPGGVDGLWFFALEVASRANAVVGRLAVPYHFADMRVDVEGDTVRYCSRRRADPGVAHDICARRGPPLRQPTELDDWLTGRWRAWVRCGPVLTTVPVEHEPWPLHEAEVLDLHENLLTGVSLPAPRTPSLVHASPGVDAGFGLPQLARID